MAELTAEAREAIREYMMRFIVLPGSILTLVSFIGGYLIHSVGEAKAYVTALEQVSTIVANDSRQIGKILAEVESQQKQIAADAGRVRRLREDIETSSKVVAAGQNVDAIANALKRDQGFQRGLTEGFQRGLIERGGFDRQAGVKLCSVTSSGRWVDVITLPAWATLQTCQSLGRRELGAEGGVIVIGCLYSDGSWDFGNGLTPPARNCGWS